MSKKHLKLIDYQENLVQSIEPEIAFNGDGDYFVDSCVSSGKSFMMAALTNELTGRVVILISIAELLDQIAEHLDIFDEPYSILKAGYDSHFDPEKRIQLIMAQTMHSRLDNLLLRADWVIQDEGQREFMSKRTQEILDHLQYRSRLLFSGTCYDSQGFQFEGTMGTFKTVPMQELINRGRLAPVKYYVPKWANNVDYDNVKLVAGEYNTTSLEEIINSKNHLAKVLESMNYMNSKNKKTLVFCSSIEQCALVTEMLKADGYYAEQVHSKVSAKDNKAIIKAFKENGLYEGHESERKEQTLFDDAEDISRPVKCLVSVNKLGIGFSVEDVQLGVLLRPTKIRSLFVQIAGRIYRSHPMKQFGEILDLAQLVKTFGFAEDPYEPPRRTGSTKTDRILIEQVNSIWAMDKLDIILNEEPTLVTRELYEAKLKEIKEAEMEFIRNKDEFKKSLQKKMASVYATAVASDAAKNQTMEYVRQLSVIINTTEDFYALISAGAEFWTIINGRPISKAGRPYDFNAEWLSENIAPALQKYPEKKKHWVKAYRTRVKNICKSGGNYNGIKFFIDYLMEQYEQELVVQSYQESQPENTQQPSMDYDYDEIPF